MQEPSHWVFYNFDIIVHEPKLPDSSLLLRWSYNLLHLEFKYICFFNINLMASYFTIKKKEKKKKH